VRRPSAARDALLAEGAGEAGREETVNLVLQSFQVAEWVVTGDAHISTSVDFRTLYRGGGQPAQAVSIGEYRCIIKIESLLVKSMDEEAHFRVALLRKALTFLRLPVFQSAPVIGSSARRFELRRRVGRWDAASLRAFA